MSDLFPETAQLLDCTQIRLAELSLYNWGSFHKLHHAAIDPQGTLITGNNGSGKSTLIDGLMALLLPAGKASFNVAAAQGDRSDRSLMSYIRGSYGHVHDGVQTRVQAKREGPTVTALRAHYRGDDGSQITLAGLFWTTQSGNSLSDLNRLYIVARDDYRLETLLADFGNGDVRGLKNAIRHNPKLSLFDGSFSAYQETWQRLLRMENRNAPALLSRALGLKKIDDLTQLIRELVLEPSTVREDAQRAVAEFDDLRSTHLQLEDARRRRDALLELPPAHQRYQKASEEIAHLERTQAQLPVWFARQRLGLYQARIANNQEKQATLDEQLQSLEQQHKSATERVQELYADYRQAGGDRIENLKKDLARCRIDLARANEHASAWQHDARELQLPDTLDRETWQLNQDEATAALEQAGERREAAQSHFGDAAGAYSQQEAQIKALEEEQRAIKARPDSNIPAPYQQFRDQMAEALDIPREQLMYLAELIDVQDEHRHWQGAIERALGGLRVTLAVPEAHYPQVTAWVNARHTGLHVRLQVAGKASGSAAPFKDDGYLRKLTWRKHPWRDWLKQHLARFDLHCVDSPEALNRTAHAMTAQGLVQHEHGRYEKKDQHAIDNKRYWSLGFSNKNRLVSLQQELEHAHQTLIQQKLSVESARKAWDTLEQQARLWERLHAVSWVSIDVPQLQNQEHIFEQDLAELQSTSGTLAKSKQRWEQAQSEQHALESQREQLNEQRWQVKDALTRSEQGLSSAQSLADNELDDSVRAALEKKPGPLVDEQLDHSGDLEREQQSTLTARVAKATGQQKHNSSICIGIIVRFRGEWLAISADWGTSVTDADDYLLHLKQLQSEGLPELVERFRARLNHHATQSLAGIREKIASEREDIRERIAVINRVLRRTEFREGSYLHLDNRRERIAHVQDFERKLTQALASINDEDHEKRYRQLEEIIAILDKASSAATAGTQESLRLLDPRHQMSFYAEERAKLDDRVLDVLESTSGKSGGEKEAFAGTIVAASLAYVLTPEGADRPVYSSVFLDEAFSNTAEAVSRRVLRVFRELHIHVNLITPFKNLNLAQDSARSLLIAERDASCHESYLVPMSWEELEQRQAEALGVSVEALD